MAEIKLGPRGGAIDPETGEYLCLKVGRRMDYFDKRSGWKDGCEEAATVPVGLVPGLRIAREEEDAIWQMGGQSVLEFEDMLRLTPREKEVVELIASGLKPSEAGEQMKVTRQRVNGLIKRVREKDLKYGGAAKELLKKGDGW